ncbi:MAG TPA: hypothetical protein V6C72_18155 [Chroococcales cyanobacterium]
MSNDAASEARSTAADVTRDAKKNPEDAYKTLSAEVQAERTKYGVDSQQYKDYVKSLGDDLKQSGVLPELTLEWTKQNNQTLADDSDHGGKITQDGIKKYLAGTDPSSFGSGIDPANALFAKQLDSTYDNLKGSNDGLSTNDINKDIKSAQAVYQQGDFIKDFLGNKNAPTALFDQLDVAGDGGKPDGWISKNDVKAFLNNKDHDEQLKAMGYTDDQIKTIDNGLKNWEDNWDSDALKSMQKDGKIGRTQLANAFGEKSIEDLAKSVQDGTFQMVPAAPDNTGTGNGNGDGNGDGSGNGHGDGNGHPTTAELTQTAEANFHKMLIDGSLVHSGDGYQAVAAMIFPNASQQEVVTLGSELQKLNGNKSVIYTNDHLLTDDKINQLLTEDPIFKQYYDSQVMAAVTRAQQQQA